MLIELFVWSFYIYDPAKSSIYIYTLVKSEFDILSSKVKFLGKVCLPKQFGD